MTTTDLPLFSEWITEHARGTVDDEMTAAIAEVVEAVSHLDAKGTVTLKVTIEPAGSGCRTVATACVVEVKPPKPDAEKSIFYVAEGGALQREDPYQKPFDLKKVVRDDAEPRLPNTHSED